MKKINVYEDNGGMIHAVVMDGEKVINIISGFEDGGLSTAEFVDAARCGFPDADEYDGEISIEAAAKEIDDFDDLIAEITDGEVELHLDKMGFACANLFSVKLYATPTSRKRRHALRASVDNI